MLKVLGEHYSFILTDVAGGAEGNDERLAFLFDSRKVKLSGLACELVVPNEQVEDIHAGAFQRQFVRTPYAVGFKVGNKTFVLVTLHILYGSSAADRIPELKAIAEWLRDWSKDMNAFDQSLLTLEILISTGAMMPAIMLLFPRALRFPMILMRFSVPFMTTAPNFTIRLPGLKMN